MSAKRYTAWRFLHPDLDAPEDRTARAMGLANARSAGLQLTARGGIDTVSEDDSVRQSVLLLLSTRPGERLMRPDYGIGLHDLVFAPNDDTTAAVAIFQVRRALRRWEPRIDILRLDAHREPANPGLMILTLEYQVRTTHTVEQVQLSINTAGGNP